jgi:hypothetical protein
MEIGKKSRGILERYRGLTQIKNRISGAVFLGGRCPGGSNV